MQEAAGITMHPSNIPLLEVNPVKFRSKFTLNCRDIRLPPFLSQFGGLRRKFPPCLSCYRYSQVVFKNRPAAFVVISGALDLRALFPGFLRRALVLIFMKGLFLIFPYPAQVYKRLQGFWGAYYLHQPSGWKF